MFGRGFVVERLIGSVWILRFVRLECLLWMVMVLGCSGVVMFLCCWNYGFDVGF